MTNKIYTVQDLLNDLKKESIFLELNVDGISDDFGGLYLSYFGGTKTRTSNLKEYIEDAITDGDLGCDSLVYYGSTKISSIEEIMNTNETTNDTTLGNLAMTNTTDTNEVEISREERIKQYMQRLVNLFREQQTLTEDVAELKSEMKEKGYDHGAIAKAAKVVASYKTAKVEDDLRTLIKYIDLYEGESQESSEVSED